MFSTHNTSNDTHKMIFYCGYDTERWRSVVLLLMLPQQRAIAIKHLFLSPNASKSINTNHLRRKKTATAEDSMLLCSLMEKKPVYVCVIIKVQSIHTRNRSLFFKPTNRHFMEKNPVCAKSQKEKERDNI